MEDLLLLLGTGFDLALVIVGFALIIVIHELGHFLAAKWAGIRVLAFGVGFGQAIVSFRQGMGWRIGSSESQYTQELEKVSGDHTALAASPTEYRLNWIPLGGYVRMLGQEDLKPEAVSAANDSYQSCPPWKRMIVISAGVIANLITAAILFIIVFMVGLKVEPPLIGGATPGSPAATAIAENADELGVEQPGLQVGDRVLRIGDREPDEFNDLIIAAAMAPRGEEIELLVERPNLDEPLRFRIQPEIHPATKLLDIGVRPAVSTRLHGMEGRRAAREMREILKELDLEPLKPGAVLIRAGSIQDPRDAHEMNRAFRDSRGEPVELEFRQPDGSTATVRQTPEPELQSGLIARDDGSKTAFRHLLGLTPVLTIGDAQSRGAAQGLEEGDIFVRLGSREYPSTVEGIREIRAHRSRDIEAIVLRQTPEGRAEEIPLTLSVTRDGTIGFLADHSADQSALIARPPSQYIPREGEDPKTPAATSIIDRPGMRILQVDGRDVDTLFDVREALRDATAAAHSAGESAEIDLKLQLPLPPDDAGERPQRSVTWALSSEDVAALHDLGWNPPLSLGLFEPQRVLLKGDGPFEAMGLGLARTHRVMTLTYLTLARLFQGTVRVEHLHGPVGIAHLGTRVAERGLIWLLFFMALISVNLAVINFLPMPIVDGGQFLMIVYEQIRGKPVPIPVQNVVNIIGLVLILALFLTVTFHDIVGLFGGR